MVDPELEVFEPHPARVITTESARLGPKNFDVVNLIVARDLSTSDHWMASRPD